MAIPNTLGSLNNHLFEQLERLNDEGITGDKLKEEIERARAITGIATQIIQNGHLVVKVKKEIFDCEIPKMLEG